MMKTYFEFLAPNNAKFSKCENIKETFTQDHFVTFFTDFY